MTRRASELTAASVIVQRSGTSGDGIRDATVPARP